MVQFRCPVCGKDLYIEDEANSRYVEQFTAHPCTGCITDWEPDSPEQKLLIAIFGEDETWQNYTDHKYPPTRS